ncbi:MAG: BatA domain-containing protein, partial [Nanoarchaeota archaeon]
NIVGLLGLLSLIPLILLYLIRPKAKEIDVPSLMFFQKDLKRKQERAFFQRLRKDWLFLLQLLGLLALSLFFAQPYLVLDKGISLDESVIVLDASASTGVGNVFERVIDEARSVVGKKNTLIMVGAAPYVALQNTDKKTTLNFFDDLEVGAVASSLGQALTLAGQYAVGAQPEIFVISDFMDTGTISFDSAREILISRGVRVHLLDVGEEKTYSNIGIIQVKPRADISEMVVKNFQTAPQQITVDVNGQIKNLNLEGLGTQIISFASKPGLHTVKLNVNDDLALDNIAYVSIPSSKKVRVLLLSDNPSRYLKAALTSTSDIELDITASLPSERYDVYILQGLET